MRIFIIWAKKSLKFIKNLLWYHFFKQELINESKIELNKAIKRLVIKNKKPKEILEILEKIYDQEIIPSIKVCQI